MEPDLSHIESSFLVPVKGRGKWNVSFVSDGEGRRVGIRVSSAEEPPREVTGILLRDLGTRFGDLTREDAEFRSAFYRQLAQDAREGVKVRAEARKLAEREAPQRMGRPRAYDLAKVADVYATAIARKDPAPVKAVADALGASRPYASKLVRQARDRGFLDEGKG